MAADVAVAVVGLLIAVVAVVEHLTVTRVPNWQFFMKLIDIVAQDTVVDAGPRSGQANSHAA